jgi:hypothetical protein
MRAPAERDPSLHAGRLVSFPDEPPHRARVISRSCHIVVVAALVAACHGGPPAPETQQPPEAPARPLAQLAAQRVIVTPAFSLLGGEALGWSAKIAKPREYLRTLDDEIATALGERGLKSQWVYPPDLVRAARTNPTYAVDPYTLGVNVLRSAAVTSGTQLGDPLVTQLRTMIALQESARAVLVPVELRFEKLPTGQGVAALRVALLDGRLGDVRWVGTVRGDPADSLSRAVLVNLATHFADLVASP